MARITVEDCIDKFPSRFELVLIASQRARKLYSGESPKVDRDNDKNTVIALREIANLSSTVEEMKENLIQEYETITLKEEEDENLGTESIESENEEDKNKHESDDPSQQVEDEIKKFTSAEESELESQYNIEDVTESSDEKSLSENEESESSS